LSPRPYILLLPLLLGACTDLFVPDVRPVPGPDGPGVAVVLRWNTPDAGPLDISRVPLLSRVRLVVDYPENHRASGGQALGLEDADLPLDGAAQEVDVTEGEARMFRVAAYQAGRRQPVYYGEKSADIGPDDGTADPQTVMIDMNELDPELTLVPLAAIAIDLQTLAGNAVAVEAGAADFELGEIDLEWTITRGGAELEIGVEDEEEGELRVSPPEPGEYRIEVRAEVGERQSEPAYAALSVLRCDEAPETLTCNEGLDCAPDGVCRDPEDEAWPADGEESDAEADGG